MRKVFAPARRATSKPTPASAHPRSELSFQRHATTAGRATPHVEGQTASSPLSLQRARDLGHNVARLARPPQTYPGTRARPLPVSPLPISTLTGSPRVQSATEWKNGQRASKSYEKERGANVAAPSSPSEPAPPGWRLKRTPEDTGEDLPERLSSPTRHHIIAKSNLATWLSNVSQLYNYGVTVELDYVRARGNPLADDKLKAVLYPLRNALRRLGLDVDQGDKIPGGGGGKNRGFTWNPMNLFAGVQAGVRDDDPGNDNEFERNNPTEAKLKERFEQGEKIWEWMRGVRNGLGRYSMHNNLDSIPALSGLRGEGMFVTSNKSRDEAGQTHWTTDAPEDWGTTEKVYKLK